MGIILLRHMLCFHAVIRHAVQVWNEQHPEEETLAFVVRTGLYTTTGLMLRQVMAPLDVLTSYNDPSVTVSHSKFDSPG